MKEILYQELVELQGRIFRNVTEEDLWKIRKEILSIMRQLPRNTLQEKHLLVRAIQDFRANLYDIYSLTPCLITLGMILSKEEISFTHPSKKEINTYTDQNFNKEFNKLDKEINDAIKDSD